VRYLHQVKPVSLYMIVPVPHEAPCYEGEWGSGCIVPRIFISALVGTKRSVSRSGHFNYR
jgi:hypothetical protein